MSETEANWKKLWRSSTSYEKAKIECLATKAGSKTEQEIQQLLQQPNSNGDGVNQEGCNLQMLYLMGKNMSASRMVTFVHIGFHLAQFL